MKILLISPNTESLPDPVFPLGLACIAGILKKHSINHKVLDLCFTADYEIAIKAALIDYKPDIAALSLRNVDNVSYPHYISYLKFYKKVIKTIKNYSHGLIILGGSGYSLLPNQLLAYLEADVGFAGAGEFTFLDFINRIKKKKNLGQYKNSGLVISQNSANDLNMDHLPPPDRSLLDCRAYLKKGGMGNIQTKRGCPFKCIYCTYPIIEGSRVRTRDPALIADEIEKLLKENIDNFFFVDNEFNYPLEHARAVCCEIIKRKLSLKWSCYANPKFITPGLIDLMLESGCTGLEFGTDAANPEMLLNMGKNFSVADLKKTSQICHRAGMAFCHSLLFGGPGETMDTVKQSCSEIISMSPTAVVCMVGIRVFPGTLLSRVAKDEGLIKPEEDFIEPVFYLTQAVEKKILPFIKSWSKNNPTWIFPGLNININTNLQEKLRRFGLRGPLWEYMKNLK